MTFFQRFFINGKAHYQSVDTLTLLEALTGEVRNLPLETGRAVEYYELGGLNESDGKNPYQDATDKIDHLIGELKAVRKEIQEMRSHSHQWSADDLCVFCGADGRA